MAWAAVVSAGVSIAGGAIASNAAKGAAKDANAGIDDGISEIKKIGDRTRSDTAPYRNLGSASASKLAALLGIGYQPVDTSSLVTADAQGNFVPNSELYATNPQFKAAYDSAMAAHQARYGTTPNINKGSNLEGTNADLLKSVDFTDYNAKRQADYEGQSGFGSLMKKFDKSDLDSDLVYQNGLKFGLDTGLSNIDARARALGGFDSGAATKAAIRYANDYGETKTAGAYDRNTSEKSNIYNMLMGTTGVGQNAVNTDASTGANLATALAGANSAMGKNNAAARVGSGNAISGALGGVGEAIGGMF